MCSLGRFIQFSSFRRRIRIFVLLFEFCDSNFILEVKLRKMPFPPSKTTYVRPLRESNDGNIKHHRTFASPNQQFEGFESSNVIGSNEEINLKNMDEVKKIYLENLNSVHSKLFAGVEEIQKWKTSVEMESKQKNKKVEELLQTLEVQRKTILDLQLENENLSYQLSEEIQQRSFVLEKLHSTKELCSALKKHYKTLQGHYEYRSKIEEGFNIADGKRLSAIESLKNKLERVCREHSEKVGYLNDALASETNKALNLKETLEQQIAIFENEKESLCRMIENQQLEIRRISTEIDEEGNKSKLVIEEKNALKFKVHELEDLVVMHSSNLKELEETLQITQNEKRELEQKLLSEKTKIDNYQMEFAHCLEDTKLQEKESEEKISSLNGTISLLEAKIHNIESQMNEEKQRNEILMSTISVLEKEKDNLESIISEAKNELASYEELKHEQASEFSVKENYLKVSVEKLKEELLQYKSEKDRESEFHNEKEENLKKMIEDYENKMVISEEKLKSLEESNAELLRKVIMLEKDLNTKTDEVFVRNEKISNLESAVNTCKEQLENLMCENITLNDKIKSDKHAICLECEQLTAQLKQMEKLNITLQKAEDALQKQKVENMEMMKILNDTEVSYNNDRIAKEKEIIKFQEQVRRLEDEMRIMNVKVEELNAIKSLNQKQKDEIKELKSSATKQEEELNELKSENEKLKESLENFKYLTVSENSLNEDKENTTELMETEDQNKSFEVKKNKTSKVSAERKKRKTKNQNLSQSKSFEKESVFSELKKNTCPKKDTAKTPPKLLENYDTDSTSSDAAAFGKNITKNPERKIKDHGAVLSRPDSSLRKNTTNAPEKKVHDDTAVLTHLDFCSKKNEKPKSPDLEKNKWEVDSSGSEYLELAFDKDSEKFMGLTPQRSPSSSVQLNSSVTKKPSAFNTSLKRDKQSANVDNSAKKFGLPLKKNKSELGNSMWMQPIRTPDRNVDFWRFKENLDMRNTSAFNTPSTPADKRKIIGNTSTPSGQRKFFKTPLSDRDNKFKKPAPQAAWSDFLKSSK
ncbi:hypothetical protein AVEN_76467-2 [Araneus ventricosus]|uniref:Synaptonemal complex protein 1 n=1 Tax=Araneus ventricosus TaxID=182803 RepID=A0A4Y2CDD2_ARAVE|nr:hypothetical protein AVEN_76467-2 [Araneus ventricosus]